MSGSHDLVYFGEIIPGHDLLQVQDALAALLKLDGSQRGQVFSGTRVVLKRNLGTGEVARYVRHLEGLGARVHVDPPVADPMPPHPASPAAVEPAQTPPVAPPQTPTAEEVVCPKCGERQPKRTLCRSCSIDMPRFQEAERARSAEERAARIAARAADRPAPGETGRSAEREMAPAWIGFDLAGRMGRLSYLWASLALSALMILGAVPTLILGDQFVLGVAIIAVGAIASFRIVALRCHDVGWGTKWALLALVPYLGGAFALLLLVVPGSAADNDFGAPVKPAGVAGAALGLVLTAIATAFIISKARTIFAPAAEARIAAEANSTTGGGVAATLDPALGQVNIYGAANCEGCEARRAQLQSLGVRVRYFALDGGMSEAELEDFFGRLKKAGLSPEKFPIPVIEIKGALLANPSAEELGLHLSGAR